MLGIGGKKKRVEELENTLSNLLTAKSNDSEMTDDYDVIREVIKVHTNKIKEKGITVDYTLSDFEKPQRNFIQRRTVSIHRLMCFLDVEEKISRPRIVIEKGDNKNNTNKFFQIRYESLGEKEKEIIKENRSKINDAFTSNLTLIAILSRCRGGQVLKSILNRFGAASIMNASQSIGGIDKIREIAVRKSREEV